MRKIRRFLSVSGMANVEQTLKEIVQWKPERNIFFDMTACAGSCVNGPKASHEYFTRSPPIRSHAIRQPGCEGPRQISLDISRHYEARTIIQSEYTELQLTEALRTLGKYSAEDELNCGGLRIRFLPRLCTRADRWQRGAHDVRHIHTQAGAEKSLCAAAKYAVRRCHCR